MDDKLYASCLRWNIPVSVAATASVQPPQKNPFQSPMGLFGQLLNIERIHQTVNRDENVSLLAVGINSLAHRYHANASKLETFEQLYCVGQGARDSTGVIHQKYVKLSNATVGGLQHPLKSWPVCAEARDRLVGESA